MFFRHWQLWQPSAPGAHGESEAFAEKSLTQVEEISRDMFLLTPEEAKRLKKEKGNFFNYLFSYYGG